MSMESGKRVRVGRIVGLHGVQGQVKLESWTEPRLQIFRYQPGHRRHKRFIPFFWFGAGTARGTHIFNFQAMQGEFFNTLTGSGGKRELQSVFFVHDIYPESGEFGAAAPND